ncbi:MAG: PKD domain-containing protein [Bacteroidales bacterium]|nr:PKD domain-containing protein [Bacteroidales bacterium]
MALGFRRPLSVYDTTSVRNPAYLYSKAGVYTTMLTVTNEFGCSDTVSQAIRVHNLPVADFSYTRLVRTIIPTSPTSAILPIQTLSNGGGDSAIRPICLDLQAFRTLTSLLKMSATTMLS